MTTDYEITLNSVPIEVLANNIFNFFEFRDWLKYLVPVCKKWQQAAVDSQQEKLIRLDLSKSATIFNAEHLVRYYRITSLILHQSGTSIYQLASIINASPRLKTVSFFPNCGSFSAFTFDDDALPRVGSTPYNPKVYMNRVTTVKLPHQHISLLCMFPNATRISLCKSARSFKFVSTHVEEVEISLFDYCHDGPQFIKDLKMKNFPNMKKLYMVIEFPIIRYQESFLNIGKDLGFELICRKPISLDLESHPSSGPLLYDNALYPSSLKVDDWRIHDEEYLQKCDALQILPFWLSVKLHLNDSEERKELAIETLKSTHPLKLDSFTDEHFVDACAKVLSILSPRRILREVGPEKLGIMLNGWKSVTVLYKYIKEFNHKPLDPTFDLLQLQDLIKTKTLQKLHNEIVDRWTSDRIGNIIHIIRELDTILQERKVDGFGSLGVDFIFNQFSLDRYSDIPSLKRLFNIDLNQMYNSDGRTLLDIGIIESSFPKINQALLLGVDPNKPNKNGITPLVTAVREKNLMAVEFLLQKGADPNVTGETAYPLHLSLMERDGQSFRITMTLLELGADVNKRYIDQKGRTVYPICAAFNWLPQHRERLQQLIRHGLDLNVSDEVGNTLLHMVQPAAENSEIISLLAKHIDINSTNQLGRTPLHHAVMGSSGSIARLLSVGADNIKDRDKNGQSFLTFLVKRSSRWLNMQYLLKCKEFIRTCQHYLTEENIRFIINECNVIISKWKDLSKAFKMITCHITLTKFFIEQVGLDVNHSDVLGNTLISCMKVTDESKDVIEYLIAKGAKICWDSVMKKEIFKAPGFQLKTYQKIKTLMKYGAVPTETNKNGVSLMDLDHELGAKLEQDMHPDNFNYYSSLYLANALLYNPK